MARVVEAFIGEYASGKSELAINRALELNNQGKKVTLVDLDTVEPFYTLRPLKELLEGMGLNVLGYSRKDSFGLGETGAMLNPQARWALMNEGDIILDIGYGVYGAKTLNLVEGTEESAELRVFAVINGTRPMTDSIERIIDYILSLGRVDAIISNTHLGNETSLETIETGHQLILETAGKLKIPVAYLAIDEKFKDLVIKEHFAEPIKFIKRYMPQAIW